MTETSDGMGYTVKLLPDAPLSPDTELAFIGGMVFVNAAKHEAVVDHHVANLRGAVGALYGAARSLELAALCITHADDHWRALDAAERARSLAQSMSPAGSGGRAVDVTTNPGTGS
jgi:hypothetical protein